MREVSRLSNDVPRATSLRTEVLKTAVVFELTLPTAAQLKHLCLGSNGFLIRRSGVRVTPGAVRSRTGLFFESGIARPGWHREHRVIFFICKSPATCRSAVFPI